MNTIQKENEAPAEERPQYRPIVERPKELPNVPCPSRKKGVRCLYKKGHTCPHAYSMEEATAHGIMGC